MDATKSQLVQLRSKLNDIPALQNLEVSRVLPYYHPKRRVGGAGTETNGDGTSKHGVYGTNRAH